MFSRFLKTGATLVLLSGAVTVFAGNQTQDLIVNGSKQTKIVNVKTTPEYVAFISQQESGKQMPPMPGAGNLAMLITGVCLVGVAARRRQVAA
ncbi:MAG: hypothetical protein ACRC1J_09925 [Sandaracinobacteroides sp.]